MTKKIGLILTVFFLTATLIYSSPVSINGKLHVTGYQLMNQCDNPVQLRGVSTHGINWFGYCYTDALMDLVANTMHADVFRVAMYTAASGGYIYDPVGNTNKVKDLVAKCVARGLYVIIDWHILSDKNPNTYITESGNFFTEMANLYKNTPNVIYEICNEPNGSAVTWSVIKTYANVIVPKIRAIAPDSLIIVGTPWWSQLGSDVAASPLAYPNIMYAFHFYAGTHNIGMLTPYLNSLPIFCSEWGASNSSGNLGDNYPNAQAFLDIMSGQDTINNPYGVKISWASWSLADNVDTSSMLTQGSCSSPSLSASNLSTAGIFVAKNAATPAKVFNCGTPTVTPTITETGTITQTHTITETHTITQTHTVTPTVTMTPTIVPNLIFKEQYNYPNPSKGDKIRFRFIHKGWVSRIKVKIFSYSDRKIAEIEDTTGSYGEPYPPAEIEWTPPWKLGNGLYYYVTELTGLNGEVARKTGALVVLQQMQ